MYDTNALEYAIHKELLKIFNNFDNTTVKINSDSNTVYSINFDNLFNNTLFTLHDINLNKTLPFFERIQLKGVNVLNLPILKISTKLSDNYLENFRYLNLENKLLFDSIQKALENFKRIFESIQDDFFNSSSYKIEKLFFINKPILKNNLIVNCVCLDIEFSLIFYVDYYGGYKDVYSNKNNFFRSRNDWFESDRGQNYSNSSNKNWWY